MKKIFQWYVIIFAVIAFFILILVPDPAEKSNTLGGLAIAAVISLFYILKSLNASWSGIITDIKTKRVYQSDDDGMGEAYDIDFAYIKLSNGKTKKIRSQAGWKVGTKLEKHRGQAEIKIIS